MYMCIDQYCEFRKEYEAHTLVLIWVPYWKYCQNKGKRSKRKGNQARKGEKKVTMIWLYGGIYVKSLTCGNKYKEIKCNKIKTKNTSLGKKSMATDLLRNMVCAYLNLQCKFVYKCGKIGWRQNRRGRGEKRSLSQNKQHQCSAWVLHRIVCYPSCAKRKGKTNLLFLCVRQSEITLI